VTKLLAAILLEVASQLVTDPATRPVMSDLLLVQRRFLSLEPLLGPLLSLDLARIDWVIVGGESGPDFRPLDLGWVRDLRDRCVSMRIPLFFKQIGGLTPKAGGRLLDGRTWDQYPARTRRRLVVTCRPI
jgi:protein gp37